MKDAAAGVESSAAGPTVNRILVVDDNPSIHDDFRRIFAMDRCASSADALATALLDRRRPSALSLPQVEFRLDHASQGLQAVQMVNAAIEAGQPYALVYMDVRMPPGLNGFESSARVLTADPDVQVVLCTAYNDYGWEQRVEELPSRDRVLILKKPFDVIEVQQLANALCEKWRFARRDRERMLALERTVDELAVANERLRQEMAQRARAQDELRKAQRLEGLGRLAAGVCHEINNPLCYIMTSIEALQDEISELAPSLSNGKHLELTELSSAVSVGSERIASIVRNIKIFARQSEVPIELVPLDQAIASAVAMSAPRLAPDVDLQVGPVDALSVLGRRLELEQVLINLIENASHAVTGQRTRPARIEIRTRRAPNGFMSIDVSDTGPGIDDKTLQKIFDPFFTTKPVNKGTGLGLSICHNLVQGMSGTIKARSALGRGTTFTVSLPAAPLELPVSPSRPPTRDRARPVDRARILVIDDEPYVLSAIERLLEEHQISTLSTAREGLAACAEQMFDLILCDLMMPSINGCDFYRMVKKMYPGTEDRIVFITGGAFVDGIREFLDEVPNRCVEKPFGSQLRAIIAEEMERHAQVRVGSIA